VVVVSANQAAPRTGAERPRTVPSDARASTATHAEGPGLPSPVSKPVRATVRTALSWFAAGPVSRRHCAVRVSPFQLTRTVAGVVPDADVTTAVGEVA